MIKKPRILIVDDREMNRYLRAQALQVVSQEILQVDTGQAAVDAAIRAQPDIILLDIHLPDMSGLEVCRALKSDPRTASIMVLQVSASAVAFTDEVIGLEGGADGYLVEPVEPPLLVAKVRSLLRLRASEENLRRSNARLEEFAAVVSHDLREPLRAISAFAELLEQEYAAKLDEQANQYLTFIRKGSSKMSQLITDLLADARFSMRPSEADVAVSLEAIVQHFQEMHQPRIQRQRATIQHDPLPELQGSQVRLGQLLENLLDNALKYARAEVPGVIHVSAKRGRDCWQISVRDNGQGFEADEAVHLFDLFKRLHGQEVAGTGLGLAICKAVVEQRGGSIWAEGAPNQGSTFYFTWPDQAS